MWLVVVGCMYDDVILQGFRVTAMPILPITSDSLIYGSSDAGNTVHDDVAEMNAAMREVCHRANLAGHVTGLGQTKKVGQEYSEKMCGIF